MSFPASEKPFCESGRSWLIQDFRYRSEVDGLRAIAVLAVVLYHAGLGVTGGYVGVDVFLVISGYLITSLIVKDLERSEFSITGFWERRARRILPAVVTLVLITMIAGWFLLLPYDYSRLGKSAVSQGVFAANVYFLRNTGYFAGGAEELPLLHTWSLAVEEQFYMLFPLALWGLFLFPICRRRNVLLAIIATIGSASLGLSIYSVSHNPASAFYLLPSRAWELLVGSFLALVPPSWTPQRLALRNAVCVLGLSGVLIPCFVYNHDTAFPGLAALVPCIGAGLILWAGRSPTGGEYAASPVTRALSLRPIVFVGLISYSLYLWHWPLIAFSNYWAVRALGLEERIGLLVLAFVLAAASWRLVEQPFRSRTMCRTKRQMLGCSVAAIAIVVATGAAVRLGNGFPQRLPAQAVQYAEARSDGLFTERLTIDDVRSGRLPLIGSKIDGKPEVLLVWGDSFAMAAAPAFDRLLRESGQSGRLAAYRATAPVLDAHWRIQYGLSEEAPAFNDAVFEYIVNRRIPNVVLVGNWNGYSDSKGTQNLDAAITATVRCLVDAGVQPWIVLEVPQFDFDVPRALASSTLFGLDISPLLRVPGTGRQDRRTDQRTFAGCAELGAVIVDPLPAFIDSDQRHLVVAREGKSFYRDNCHLSTVGAEVVLLPTLRETVGRRLGKTGAALSN